LCSEFIKLKERKMSQNTRKSISETGLEWWQKAVIYHIYPRSFQDANGDGIGDLKGITSRLDYLAWLGVEAIWISPVYTSPMADFGYDVTDHCDIDPMFGSLADMDELIASAHQKGLKVILDFVPNHTSDQHPWFLESKSSRENPKRNWYYWKDPAPGGGPPNNWLSRFDGQSAWKWDEATAQYYLHTFLEEQPDLNWRNPEVQRAMLDILRFWFERGVDGFRVDVSYRVMKDRAFRNNPLNPDWKEGMDRSFRVIERNTKNTEDIHQFNRWIRQTADEYEQKVTIGEMNLKIPELVKHYGQPEQHEFHLPFNFRLIFTPWQARNVRRLMDEFEAHIPAHGWPNWVLSNHDQPRFASRAGTHQTRCGHLFLLTARGTPTLYYGDELGMESVPIPSDRVQDPWELLSPGLGLGRDPVRTPMQWDSGKNAGFSHDDVAPWLPVAPDSHKKNVQAEKNQHGSMLLMVRRLLQLRNEHLALVSGSCRTLKVNHQEHILAYERIMPGSGAASGFVILLNFSNAPRQAEAELQAGRASPINKPGSAVVKLIFSTYMDEASLIEGITDGTLHVQLRPDEGLILEIM
jgi:alpha-glucosidase